MPAKDLIFYAVLSIILGSIALWSIGAALMLLLALLLAGLREGVSLHYATW
jgi:hypothetical protein